MRKSGWQKLCLNAWENSGTEDQVLFLKNNRASFRCFQVSPEKMESLYSNINTDLVIWPGGMRSQLQNLDVLGNTSFRYNYVDGKGNGCYLRTVH